MICAIGSSYILMEAPIRMTFVEHYLHRDLRILPIAKSCALIKKKPMDERLCGLLEVQNRFFPDDEKQEPDLRVGTYHKNLSANMTLLLLRNTSM